MGGYWWSLRVGAEVAGGWVRLWSRLTGQNTGCSGQFLPEVGGFEVTLAGADVFVVWS